MSALEEGLSNLRSAYRKMGACELYQHLLQSIEVGDEARLSIVRAYQDFDLSPQTLGEVALKQLNQETARVAFRVGESVQETTFP